MPDTTAGLVREWAEHGQVNILGGCYGSTPAHIAAMAKAVAGLAPRHIPDVPVRTRLAGLEPFTMAACSSAAKPPALSLSQGRPFFGRAMDKKDRASTSSARTEKEKQIGKAECRERGSK